MKILQLTALVFITSINITTAQTNKYHKFPDSNAIWCDSTGAHGCTKTSYTITGDTIINNKTYHKITENKHYCQIGVSGTCECDIYSNVITAYAGSIRQDTTLRKVYFIQPSATNDTLLYDFTLQVGDTLKTYGSQILASPPPYIMVTSIDSILIGTSYRKRWIVNQSGIIVNGQIIEGMGSTAGLFNWMVNTGAGGEPTDHLYCFSQNNQTFYPYYSSSAVCALVTGIKTFQTEASIFQIYPNPNDGNFIVEPNNTEKQTLQIFDINGKMILNKLVTGKTIIHSGNLQQGVYNISLLSNKGVTNKKVVIVK